MKSGWGLVWLAAAAGPMGGCVIAIGNKGMDGGSEWRDDTRRPRMGVTLSEVGRALASQLRIDGGSATLITSVSGGMPADKAGLREDDVVVAINGSDHASPADLRRTIERAGPGEEIRLRVIRAGESMDITVVMAPGAPAGPQE